MTRADSSPRPADRRLRLDIQVLRAAAVSAVLLYHLSPGSLPGGFIGVDVFFVISGFLITSHLVQSATGERGVRVGRFWANRARRLLPLSGVVLLATIGGIFAFLPPSVWSPSLRDVIASALYVENWSLARSAIDYLGKDLAPPPTQHFWSLSVEEQFYLVWPLLILVVAAIAARIARRRSADAIGAPASQEARARLVRLGVIVVLVAIVAASLAHSLVLTATDPSLAYFATTTRAWEFAAGGLLAAVMLTGRRLIRADRADRAVRVAASWVGYALIAATALLLPVDTPFPGTAALLPVVGALLCLWSGDLGTTFAPTLLARVRPITYLGDISYGVYLWHWPLIVLYPAAVGHPAGLLAKLGILVAAIGLAALSKVAVEDPFRFGRLWTERWWRGFLPAATVMALVCLIAGGGVLAIRPGASSAAPSTLPSLDPTRTTDPDLPLVPAVAARAEDKAGMYDCFDLTHSAPHVCQYGPKDAAVSIAVAGDSHAAQLIPALKTVAEKRGWSLTTYVGVNCDGPLYYACAGGAGMLDSLLGGHYDLVVVSTYRGSTTPEDEVRAFWSRLSDAGVRVVPVIDTPTVTQAAYSCIDDSGGDPVTASACVVPRAEAFGTKHDRVAPIAKELGIEPIDLTPLLCDASACFQVIDNVIVYQDLNSHFTTTMSTLLAPTFDRELTTRLG